MGDRNLNLALAHTALAISSGWSLVRCSELKFARVGFCLYLANGVFGVVDYVLPQSNTWVKRIHAAIARCTRPVYLPLIAAEAFLYAGFDEKFSYCHLVFPGAYLFLTEILKKNISSDYLNLSSICNTGSICFSAYTKQDLYGGVCGAFNLAAFLGCQYNSIEYLLLIGCANVAAVQFFTKFF